MKELIFFVKKISFFIFWGVLVYPACLMGQSSVYGDFPFENSFLSNIQPSYVTVPGSNNSATFTNDGISLTTNAANQFGAVFLNDRQFTSDNGIVIEFEYMMYGGTGGDGLCMFLFDASLQNPEIGSPGSGLGYTYNWSRDDYSSTRKAGLDGAYLAVAFDSYGNFKNLRYESNDRKNGIPYQGLDSEGNTKPSNSVNGALAAQYDAGDQVTLRGAKGVPLTSGSVSMADGYTGYPVLATRSTTAGFGFEVSANSPYNYIASTAYSGSYFPINGSGIFTGEDSEHYRRAIVELYPAVDAGGGFYVTVKIVHGTASGPVTDTLIEDYHYKPSFGYQENAMVPYQFNPDIPATTPPTFTLNANVPDSLRIGFAASTGAQTNNNVIKNIKITLPGSAVANDDPIENPTQSPIEIFPLLNDLGYTGTIGENQSGSYLYLDPETFRFWENDTTLAANAYSCTTSDGVWTYSPVTEKVSFVPIQDFTGTASIRYDIKGGGRDANKETPFSDEAYRSTQAVISVKIDTPIVTTSGMVTNKMITVKAGNGS